MRAFEDTVSSLDELCRALNTNEAGRADYLPNGTRSPEIMILPQFSSVAPPDLSGIWSWDSTRMLLRHSNGMFYIEPRDPEIWYPNEKGFPSR